MRSLWLLFLGSIAVAGCWVSRGELLEKVHQNDPTAETGDTGS